MTNAAPASRGLSTTSSTSAPTKPYQLLATMSLSPGGCKPPPPTAADGQRLLPSGRNTDLPWLGINQLGITLSTAATLSTGNFTVVGASGTNYGPVTVSGSGTNYTFTLVQPIDAADRVAIAIVIPDVSTFIRLLDVLPGDFNDDGVVNSQDVVGVRNEWLRINGPRPQSLATSMATALSTSSTTTMCASGWAQLCRR